MSDVDALRDRLIAELTASTGAAIDARAEYDKRPLSEIAELPPDIDDAVLAALARVAYFNRQRDDGAGTVALLTWPEQQPLPTTRAVAAWLLEYPHEGLPLAAAVAKAALLKPVDAHTDQERAAHRAAERWLRDFREHNNDQSWTRGKQRPFAVLFLSDLVVAYLATGRPRSVLYALVDAWQRGTSMNRLFKYVSIKRLKDILIDHKIRFTQSGSFNDPFELLPLLLASKGAVHQGHINYKFSLNARRRGRSVDTKGAENCGSDYYSRKLRESLDREIGFLSLSRTWKTLPMWAYYAENYAGAVIEFDGNHKFFEWAFDVHYSYDRPIHDLALYLSKPIPIAEMCNKSTEWEHEREVRVPRCLSDCEKLSISCSGVSIYVSEVPRDCIKRVIVGERAKQDVVKEIFNIIENTDIVGHRAVINHFDYNLELMPLARFAMPFLR